MLFTQRSPLFEIVEDATTSIGADLSELSEGAEEVSEPKVETPEVEVEEPETEVEEEAPETEEEEVPSDEEPETPEVHDLHPFERPTIKQLNESFPDLFKKFPSLREMYFREAEYSKLFPTVEDAREAGENNTAFMTLRSDVFEGSGQKFFEAIKEVSDKNLQRFSSGILSTLFKVDPQSFWSAANPLIENVAQSMFTRGQKENNENLQNAAKYLSDYFFGSTEIAEGKKTSIVKIEENSEVSKERQKFDDERHTAFRGGVETSLRSQLVSLIDAKDPKSGKSRLDPDGVFSPFIRTTIIDKIIADLGSQLSSDRDHLRYMDSLWSKAKSNGRTDADKARIISAYLARAKSLIPTLRSKLVSEALGQNVRRSVKNKEQVERTGSRTPVSGSGRNSNGRQNYDPKSIDYSKTSDADLLNDNVTYK